MFQVLTVCTGNICRSPLAEVLLTARLENLGAVVASAGTRGLPQAPMTPEAQRLAAQLGGREADISAHRSRFLVEGMLGRPDLILTMTRDHRREVAELAPARLRSAFTVREFARLAASVTDEEVRAAAAEAGSDAGARVRAAALLLASRRGLVMPPPDPADDDVIDPYRRSWETYVLSGTQLTPALAEVERVLRAAIDPVAT